MEDVGAFKGTYFKAIRGLSQMTSAPKGGRGVSEMLTKPDIGGRGGLTNDDVSKKGHFAAIPTNTKTRIPNF